MSGCFAPRTLFLAELPILHTYGLVCMHKTSIHIHMYVCMYVHIWIRLRIYMHYYKLCFLVSITCTSNSSASFHRSWLLYVDAKLPMLARLPITSDCKCQPSKRHILADSGTDRMSHWVNVVERFAQITFRRFLPNAPLQSDVMDIVHSRSLGKDQGSAFNCLINRPRFINT